MSNLDSIFKSRDIAFPTKGPSSQGYGFSCGHVWMWELDCEESWALKNWYFWSVVLEQTLESPLDCKEIQPVHSEGDQPWDFFGKMMLKLKLQYFGHLVRRVDSLEKTLMLGGIGGRRRRGRQRVRWLGGITDSMDASLNSRSWWWIGRPGVLRFMELQRVRHDWAIELKTKNKSKVTWGVWRQSTWKREKQRNRKSHGKEKRQEIQETIQENWKAEMYTSSGEEVQDVAREISTNEWCRTLEVMLNYFHFFTVCLVLKKAFFRIIIRKISNCGIVF